jgi:hypothetical protein
MIEERSDVGIQHMREALSMDFPNLLDCLMIVALWPEAVRMIMKRSLKQRTQQLSDHLLDDSSPDRGNPWRAKPPGAFRV